MASESHHMFPMGLAPEHHLSVHHNPYSSAWSAPPPQQIAVRQYPSTSSAFSASAHPDEDWTKVSDLAERRRIQNRIAQRNYRKKIKQRMEYLESKAGDGTKNTASSKRSPKTSNKKQQQQQQQQQRRQSSPPTTIVGAPLHATHTHNPFTPPMNPEDQAFFPSPSPPASSPPPFGYQTATYSPPSESGFYGGAPVTTWMATTATTATAAPTLPPMTHFSEAYKQAAPGGNESMSSFASYGDYSLGVPVTASPYDSNPHVSSHHHHQQRSTQHNSTLLPPVSTFPSYGGSSHSTSSSSSSSAVPLGHLAAPDPYRPRYAPPPPPARV